MSRTALYRKYRSRSLDDLVGQDHITQTLQNALKHDRLSHAYLFTGPRGVGKTSTARIIAHEINKIQYDESTPHIDIIEIDAASNRRIDEIRDLRETIHIAPTELDYKIYIIDEVHMLTKEAFNALLKTLEEPPEHAIFILATTEAHKLPPTIISRTQQFTFRPVAREAMVEHLKSIATAEKIDINDDALVLIAEQSDGSFRDAISLLDQLSSINKEISAQTVQSMLGVLDDHLLNVIHAAVAEGDIASIMSTVESAVSQGKSPSTIATQYAKFLRNDLLNNKSATETLHVLETIQRLLAINRSAHPELELEIILSQAATKPMRNSSVATPSENKSTLTKQHSLPKTSTQISEQPNTKQQKPEQISHDRTEDWNDVLLLAKDHTPALYAALRQASPEISKDTIQLNFKFALHARKAQKSKQLKKLIEIVHQIFGEKELSIAHKPSSTPTTTKSHKQTTESPVKETAKPDTITEINSLLGGEIVTLS